MSSQSPDRPVSPPPPQWLTDVLDPEQLEAVLAPQRAVQVLAGAGSGKTRALSYRIAYLLGTLGVPAHRLLALTFTNKAANQMRQRVEGIVGQERTESLWTGTFHSICARLLRRHAHLVGRTPHFVIYDDQDSTALVKQILKQMEPGIDGQVKPKVVASWIASCKDRLIPYEESTTIPEGLGRRQAVELAQRVDTMLSISDACDFADLIRLPLRLYQEHPEALRSVADRFLHILVDEYQDTNKAQHLLVKCLASVHGQVWVVGDDDQSIYGWRGAEIRNMVNFGEDFPQTRLIRLERNYRSTANILAAADGVISKNRDRLGKVLRPTKEDGCLVETCEFRSPRAEAEAVAEDVRRWVVNGDGSQSWGDVGILYRTNAQSRVLEEALSKYRIPHVVVGGPKFYGRAEVKDLLAYAKLAVNPNDEVALRRVINLPRRKLGPKAIGQIEQAGGIHGFAAGIRHMVAQHQEEQESKDQATKAKTGGRAIAAIVDFWRLVEDLGRECPQMEPGEALDYILNKVELENHYRSSSDPQSEDRIRNLKEVVSAAAEASRWDKDLILLSYLEGLSLASSADVNVGDNRVSMMTVHVAKGLEFPVVYVVGLEDGLFPLIREGDANSDSSRDQEERRLAYVAFTRACDRLVLSHATSRTRGLSYFETHPSPYLFDIPRHVLASRVVSERDYQVPHDRNWWSNKPQSLGQPSHHNLNNPFQRKTEHQPSSAKGADKHWTDCIYYSDAPQEDEEEISFQRGQMVEHKIYGPGRVLEIKGNGAKATVRVQFESLGIKRIRANALMRH